MRWRPLASFGLRRSVLVICVAGAALGDMDCHFTWQAWHLRHCVGTGDALGCGLSPHTAWQAWHFVTLTFTLRGKRGTW